MKIINMNKSNIKLILSTVFFVFSIVILLSSLHSPALAGVGPAQRDAINELQNPDNIPSWYLPPPGITEEVPGVDMTVWRTVNSISCAPQNPYAHEIPMYVGFHPSTISFDGGLPADVVVPGLQRNEDPKVAMARNGAKGFCFALHHQADPNMIGRQVWTGGSYNNSFMSNDGTVPRGKIHYRHYMVYEFPNPLYNPDPSVQEKCQAMAQRLYQNPDSNLTANESAIQYSCGKWFHWEGKVRIFQVAIVTNTKGPGSHDVWYVKEHHHGMELGQNRHPAFATEMQDQNGNIIKVKKTVNGVEVEVPKFTAFIDGTTASWKLRANTGAPRTGDEDRPALKWRFDIDSMTLSTMAHNPNNYYYIPHNENGKPYWKIPGKNITFADWATKWVKCGFRKDANGGLETSGIRLDRVYPVTPLGCDHPSIDVNVNPQAMPDPGVLPTALYVDPVVGGSTTQPPIGNVFSINGVIYEDTNPTDGVKGPNESGKAGVTLRLSNSSSQVVGTVQSGADGSFSFGSLAAGNYSLSILPPRGYVSSEFSQGTRSISFSAVGPTNRYVSFGLVPNTDTVVTPQPTVTTAPPTSDNTPPIIQVTFPKNGTVYSNREAYTRINVSASDASGISLINIYVDDALIGHCGSSNLCNAQWNGLSTASRGPHIIKATATDKAKPVSNTASNSITVTKNY